MRVGIVDNATLTASQRLLGDIQIANLHNIDGDIVAFENLVQAILFYDDLYFIDDYKPEYSKARLARFPFIKPLTLTETNKSKLEDEFQKKTTDLMLRVEGGDITPGLLRDFFNQLSLQFVFAWQMSGSDFLLNVKLLGGTDLSSETVGKLVAMLKSQQIDLDRTILEVPLPKPILIGSDGCDMSEPREREGKKFDVGEDVKQFAKNLNWLCQRTSLYSVLALQCNADPVLHPIRSSFALSFAGARLGLPTPIRQRIVALLKDPSEAAVIEIKSASDPFAVIGAHLPIFLAWIALHSDNPNDFLSRAFELKSHPKILAIREKLFEIETSEGSGGNLARAVNKTVRELRQALDEVRAEFSVQTSNGLSLSPVVNISNAALAISGQPYAIPDLGIRIPGISSWRSRGYRGVFRSIVTDLGEVAKLGALHEKITQNVQRMNDARFVEPKIEPPELRYAKPYWKRPM